MITTREEYNKWAIGRGIDPLLIDNLDFSLRREIQREKFGKNNAEGNAKFYRYCLTHKLLVCEHCGTPIRHPNAYNVSHILTRGAHQEMSHDPRNVNILCPRCHDLWEQSTTRGKMSPFFLEKNKRQIEKLKKEYQDV